MSLPAPPRTALVVGGGVAGLWAARALARQGVEPVVLEARRVGSGASRANGGWVCPAQAGPIPGPGVFGYGVRSVANRDSALYIAPKSLPGLASWLAQFTRRCNERDHAAGVRALCALTYPSFDLITELEQRRPALYVGRAGLVVVAGSVETIEKYLHEFAPIREAGYAMPTTPDPLDELRAREPALTDRVTSGLFVEDHWQVDPGQLCDELAAELRDDGVEVREGVEVLELVRDGERICRVRTTDGERSADVVVLASGATTALTRSVGFRLPVIGGKGYSFDVIPRVMPKHSILFMDAHVGCAALGDHLRVAGTMELGGDSLRIDPRRLRTLENAVRPFIGDWEQVGEPWAGLRPLSPDGLPLIGRAPGIGNLYVATGYSMLGMTVSPMAGVLLAEEIVGGRRPAALEPFRVDRFALRRSR